MTERPLLAAFCLSILASGATAQTAPCRLIVAYPISENLLALRSASDPLLSAYPKCVEAKVQALYPSGQSPDDIAPKAIGACKAERAVFAEAMAACGDTRFRGELTVQEDNMVSAIFMESWANTQPLPPPGGAPAPH